MLYILGWEYIRSRRTQELFLVDFGPRWIPRFHKGAAGLEDIGGCQLNSRYLHWRRCGWPSPLLLHRGSREEYKQLRNPRTSSRRECDGTTETRRQVRSSHPHEMMCHNVLYCSLASCRRLHLTQLVNKASLCPSSLNQPVRLVLSFIFSIVFLTSC